MNEIMQNVCFSYYVFDGGIYSNKTWLFLYVHIHVKNYARDYRRKKVNFIRVIV